MTPEEYRNWIIYHRQCHPEWAQWADSQEAEARRTLSDIWQVVLGETPLDAAKAISREMVTGPRSHPAKWDYNQVARVVADAVRDAEKLAKAASFELDAKPHRPMTYRCHSCRDSGWRPVYSRKFVAAAMAGEVDRKRAASTNVSCDCQQGVEIATAQKLSDAQQFRTSNWCDATFAPESEAAMTLLLAWIEDRPATDYDELNDWNES